MTNEECVKILQQVKDGDLLTFDKSRRKALDMAIEMIGNSPTQMSETSGSDNNVGGKDAVYRQDAIEAVKHAWAKDLEPSQYIESLPSAQPKQQWIPCSERLPDKEGQYLVTDEAGGVVSIICDVFFHYDDGAPTWLLSQNVVAWMPLPEPYKEGEE